MNLSFSSFIRRVPGRMTPALSRTEKKSRSGQTLIFLLMTLVVLTLAVLWAFDWHKILMAKFRARDAGDGAALAAARWQGVSLNMIGDLNILQAVAISESLARGDDTFFEARAIAELQARLCYAGPLMGAAAAQQVAKNNRINSQDDFTSEVSAHAAEVRENYPVRFPAAPFAPMNGAASAWEEYANMLSALAAEGIAAQAENRQLYVDYADWNHLLLNPSFYDAVATYDWCWFYFNAMSFLTGYGGWTTWPELPENRVTYPMNSEYYSLKLTRYLLLDWLPRAPGGGTAWDALRDQSGAALHPGVVETPATWFACRPESWSSWSDFLPSGFPFSGRVRPEYDYTGADAAVRVKVTVEANVPGGSSREVVWTAAAKPFGHLLDGAPPNAVGLVLPVFTDVRLIPLDASSAPAGGSRPGWADHIYEHLPRYLARGLPGLAGGCWYCSQLNTWENPSFRQQGIDWLEENSAGCHLHRGGSGPGGGTRRGH